MAMDDPCRVFVGGLPFDCTEADEGEFMAFFSVFGKVRSAKIIMDKAANKCRGYGFVAFETPESAIQARAAKGMRFKSHAISVSQANRAPNIPYTPYRPPTTGPAAAPVVYPSYIQEALAPQPTSTSTAANKDYVEQIRKLIAENEQERLKRKQLDAQVARLNKRLGTVLEASKLEDLPDILLVHVLKFLRPKDILRRVALVNKRFHRLARCPALWRLQCESRRLAGLAPEPRKKAARTPSRDWLQIYKEYRLYGKHTHSDRDSRRDKERDRDRERRDRDRERREQRRRSRSRSRSRSRDRKRDRSRERREDKSLERKERNEKRQESEKRGARSMEEEEEETEPMESSPRASAPQQKEAGTKRKREGEEGDDSRSPPDSTSQREHKRHEAAAGEDSD